MHVAIVGAGVVGLSTAWYLNERGIDVTMFEKSKAGTGASWGNAGQIIPPKAVPLAEPGNLRVELSSFYTKNSPITAPKTFNCQLISFLFSFGKNSTTKKFISSTKEMMSLSVDAMSEYEYLESKSISTTRVKAPFTAAFTSAEYAKHLLEEYYIATQFGNYMNISLLGVEELRKREPLVGENFHFGIELEDQALLDPPQFVEYLVSNLQKMVFLLSKIVQFRRLNEALENCE